MHECFLQGELEVVKEIHGKHITENGDNQSNGNGDDGGAGVSKVILDRSKMPFLMLGLDLPPPPLFKDIMEKNIIPQVRFLNCISSIPNF